jgi:Holliday junction resolvasome RuvABC endonuclease subunit
MNILALDVATVTGYCTANTSGIWDFSLKRDESSGIRLLKFEKALIDILEKESIELVVFERTAGAHKNAIIVQSELHGVLKSTLEKRKIAYKAYSAKEIKKYATGNGNASKTLMVQKAQEKLNLKSNNDNEADAMWIYQLALTEFN